MTWHALTALPPRVRWGAAAGVLGLAALAWLLIARLDLLADHSGRVGMPLNIVVAERPVVQRLALVGTIEPGGVVNVVVPFDGAVKEKITEFGTRVKKGQALLVLDTTEIDLQIREAEAARIKAEQTVNDMKNWESTPEVMRARNQVSAAQMKIEELGRKEAETKALLSRGIIPRIEHDGVVEQLNAQRLQLEGARQDLNAVLRRGDAEHRRLAQLEMETARKRLAELQRQMDAGLVEAPAAGLLLRPTANEAKGGTSPAEVEVGSRVAKGQPLFSIADTDTLKVVARLDEIDVNKVAEEMQVEISGEAFGAPPQKGRVVHISAQADPSSRTAVFQVVIAMTPPAELKSRIRVGMSANLSIATYYNPTALTLPVSALRNGPQGDYVLVRDEATGEAFQRRVVVGRPFEDGVEIVQGLKAGEVVVADNQAAPVSPAAGGLALPPGGQTLGTMGRL